MDYVENECGRANVINRKKKMFTQECLEDMVSDAQERLEKGEPIYGIAMVPIEGDTHLGELESIEMHEDTVFAKVKIDKGPAADMVRKIPESGARPLVMLKYIVRDTEKKVFEEFENMEVEVVSAVKLKSWTIVGFNEDNAQKMLEQREELAKHAKEEYKAQQRGE